MGSVYRRPLSCSKDYIGQSGRWVGDRLRGHALSARSSSAGLLAIHCGECVCAAKLETEILRLLYHKSTRGITEAFYISRCMEGWCVSAPSVALYQKNIDYFGQYGASCVLRRV